MSTRTNPTIWYLRQAGRNAQSLTVFTWTATVCPVAEWKFYLDLFFRWLYAGVDSCTVITHASLSSWIAVCDANCHENSESQSDKGIYMSGVPFDNKIESLSSSIQSSDLIWVKLIKNCCLQFLTESTVLIGLMSKYCFPFQHCVHYMLKLWGWMVPS